MSGDLTHQQRAQIAELEIKLAHQEDTIEQLNDALVAQQFKIQGLEKKLDLLLDLLKELKSSGGGEGSAETMHEVPPHY